MVVVWGLVMWLGQCFSGGVVGLLEDSCLIIDDKYVMLMLWIDDVVFYGEVVEWWYK